MLTVTPGAAFEATTIAASGLTGTLGVRIRDNAGADFLARTTAGIAADVTVGATSVYRRAFTAPTTAGQWTIVWDNGTAVVDTEELLVSYSAVSLGVGDAVGLTTLQKLRLHVLRNAADDSADDKLALYGEAMSDRVTDYCAREFLPAPGGSAVERVFDYDGSGTIDLRPYDLRELDSITFYTDRDDAVQQELTVGQYRLQPPGRAKGGTYLSIDVLLPTLSPLYYGFAWQVTVAGLWGMASVPRPVELAVLIAVDNVMKNPGSWASEQIGGFTVAPDVALSFEQDPRGGLPRDAIYACAPYRRKKRVGSVALRHPSPGAVHAWGANVANRP